MFFFPERTELEDKKGVLVDLDNTLYAYGPRHERALKKCFEFFSETKGDALSEQAFFEKYLAKRNEVKSKLKAQGAARSRFLAFQWLFEELGVPQAFGVALTFDNVYWSEFVKSMSVAPEALDFLKICKNLKIPVCIVSDMQACVQVQKLQEMGIDKLISYLVTSEEVGVEKPAPEIFLNALEKVGCLPSEVVMVGDDYEKDILGAEALGIKSFQVKLP